VAIQRKPQTLATGFPHIARSWHRELNGDLTPKTVSAFSHKKVWWRCKAGHEWQATVANRTAAGSRCPFCAGTRPTAETSLLAKHPELAKEWHPTKNEDKSPSDFLPKSSFKAWWRCPRGHEWAATISHRTNGSGCPNCGGGSSALEARIYSELRALFQEVVWHSSQFGVQLDIYLPELQIGIEIDGHYWHANKIAADRRKNQVCSRNNIRLVRIRQHPLKPLDRWDIVFERSEPDLEVCKRLLSSISSAAGSKLVAKVAASYGKRSRLIADDDYRTIIAKLPGPPKGASFADRCPEAAAEWDTEKNAPLEPSMFAPKANRSVWWKCSAKGHAWQAAIHSRATGVGCPYCARNRVGDDNNLAVARPDLLYEWNSERNGPLRPDSVAKSSRRKVWWRCRARGHEWEASIGNRVRGADCPYCSGNALSPEKSLAALRPDVVASWDFGKNAPLRPEDVHSQSNRVVWWKCPTCKTSWQSDVQHRFAAVVGCPKCSRRHAGEQMRIARLRTMGTLRMKAPEIAARWHPHRNGTASPDLVGRHSTRLAWWLCPDCSHEWASSPHTYRGCPKCGSK